MPKSRLWFRWAAASCGLLVACGATGASPAPLPGGEWGGKGIRLVTTETGATIEYDCAAGRIETPIRPDPDGDFEARGTHTFERGGPSQPGPPPPAHVAVYRGWTDGTRLRLTVRLPDLDREIGTFELERGRAPALEKCL